MFFAVCGRIGAVAEKIICSDDLYIFFNPGDSIYEVMTMDKQELEKQQSRKFNEEFNSITRKVKVENQNQTHNVRQEGTTPINQKR